MGRKKSAESPVRASDALLRSEAPKGSTIPFLRGRNPLSAGGSGGCRAGHPPSTGRGAVVTAIGGATTTPPMVVNGQNLQTWAFFVAILRKIFDQPVQSIFKASTSDFIFFLLTR